MNKLTDKSKFRIKSLVILIGCLLLTVSVVTGTLTWITTQDKKENSFTVGSFTKPEIEDPENQGEMITLDGYIYEPNWDLNTDGHKLVPGSPTVKDPKVGIGAGSEDAYVYVYIENEYSEDVYFMLDENWTVVYRAVVKTGVDGAYVCGLFRYINTLAPEGDETVWTTPIFTEVITDESADNLTEKNINVYAYIHQATNGTQGIPKETVNEAAIAWVDSLLEP